MPRIGIPYVDPTLGEECVGRPELGPWAPGTVDAMFTAPPTVSVYYASLCATARMDDAEWLLEAHELCLRAALLFLNRKASQAVVSRSRQAHAVRRKSRGLRVVQLEHTEAAPAGGAAFGDPQLHTHLFIDPAVTGRRDGRQHPLDLAQLERMLPAAAALYHRGLAHAATPRLGRPRTWQGGAGPAPRPAGNAGTACRPFAELRQIVLV